MAHVLDSHTGSPAGVNIGDVSFDELKARIVNPVCDVFTLSLAEIVERAYSRGPRMHQVIADIGADESRSTRDENLPRTVHETPEPKGLPGRLG